MLSAVSIKLNSTIAVHGVTNTNIKTTQHHQSIVPIIEISRHLSESTENTVIKWTMETSK